jgi:hypothetical protein
MSCRHSFASGALDPYLRSSKPRRRLKLSRSLHQPTTGFAAYSPLLCLAQAKVSYMRPAIRHSDSSSKRAGRRRKLWITGLQFSRFFLNFTVMFPQDKSPLAVSRHSLKHCISRLLLVKTSPPGFLRAGWHNVFETCYSDIARCPGFLYRQDTWTISGMYLLFPVKF